MTGYVVEVSPVKVAKTSGKPYFMMEIQTAEKLNRALSFSPSKRRLFNELCADRRGCVINNVKSGKDTLYVNEYSTVVEKKLGFNHYPKVKYMTIGEVINQVPTDAKVNVRGVVLLQEVRSVRVRSEDVNIREGHLVDESSRIKLALWREYCELLENRAVYDLKNLVKMKYSGEIRLQSLHNTTYALSEVQIEEYDPLPVLEDKVLFNATVAAVEAAARNCTECNKPISDGNDKELLVKCGNCCKVMMRTSLKRKKMHYIIINSGENEYDKRKLSCHHEQLQTCFPEKIR